MFLDYTPDIETGLIEHPDGTKLSLKGVCRHCVYSSDKNEFAIMRFEDSDENTFKIKGNIKDMKEGCSYDIEGIVRTYNGEKQLSITCYTPCEPCTKKAIIAYMQTLPGLHTKAELIYDEFGENSLEVLRETPEKITSIKGIGQKSAEKWALELKKTIGNQTLILKLLDYGFTQKQALELSQEYDSHILTRLKTNPYFLMHEMKGYGFFTCDKIALTMGISLTNQNRILHASEHILEQTSLQGNTYLPLEKVIPLVTALLQIKCTANELTTILTENMSSITKYNATYDIDLNHANYCRQYRQEYVLATVDTDDVLNCYHTSLGNFLILEDNNLYLRRLYHAEQSFAEQIVHLCESKIQVFTREEVSNVLDVICKKDNIVLEEQQKEAVITFNMYDTGVFVLNGSAGTGKTFVAKLILKVNEALNYVYQRKQKVQLLALAPTGKASKVMSKSLNMECKTIHRALECNECMFMRNASNPFEENTIYVDESSMLDIELAHNFIKAVRTNTKLIFIGDVKQLASVGPGKVLSDLIESKIPIIVTLNVVKRQGKFSGIIKNANRIIEGESICSEPETDDFYIYEESQSIRIQQRLVQLYVSMSRKYSYIDVQILTPQRPGDLGVNMLNYLLQQEMNPIQAGELFMSKSTFEVNNMVYELKIHEGDKVINVKNDYNIALYQKEYGQLIPMDRTGVTNGECGVVDEIRMNADGKLEAVIKFDDYYVCYDSLTTLELAYAITIHKSQGSQWPVILMPIAMQHSYILSNNLLYTGVTRAQNECQIIGQMAAINKAIITHKDNERYSSLLQRLIQEQHKYMLEKQKTKSSY